MGSILTPPPPFGSAAATLLGGFAPQTSDYGAAAAALLGGFPVFTPNPPLQWHFVRRRFGLLLGNLDITETQREDGETKAAGIWACLNRHYYGHSSESANGMLIGSWGKDTRVRPPRDVDLLFLLPSEVYWRFGRRLGNRQSQLLQEIKGVLSATYPQTMMRADRQVVVVPFNTTAIEIAPGFRCSDGSIITCDASGNGSYVTSTAEAELIDLNATDSACNGNARALVRMMKAWQRERNVPIKSFWLEGIAVEFLGWWPHRRDDVFYYDWMVRDFLAYLISRVNGRLIMPGTGEVILLGADWLSRAQTAHRRAVSACENEQGNYEALAGSDWREIFGVAVPMLVS